MNWKPILGYNGHYEVSDCGDVRSLGRIDPRGRVVRPRLLSAGNRPYARVVLMRDGQRSERTVHSLVLEAFVGPRPEGFVCRHLNGDSRDNSLGNLAWGTQAENIRDKRRHGTMACGERVGSAKLTWAIVREIRSSPEVTATEWSRQLPGISRRAIAYVKSGETWREHAEHCHD